MTSPQAAMIPCPFCGSQEAPDFEHMVWSCEHFRETRPACGAFDPLQRLLAWPSQAMPRRENLQVILHAAEVRMGVLRARHDTGNSGPVPAVRKERFLGGEPLPHQQ